MIMYEEETAKENNKDYLKDDLDSFENILVGFRHTSIWKRGRNIAKSGEP